MIENNVIPSSLFGSLPATFKIQRSTYDGYNKTKMERQYSQLK